MQRVIAVGTPDYLQVGLHEIIAYKQRSSSSAVDDFLGTAYHRIPLVDYATMYIGIGNVDGNVVILTSMTEKAK